MTEITRDDKDKMIELVDGIIFKADSDMILRKNMAFTWEHLSDADRFNIFMIGLIVTGLIKEWKEE